MGVKALNRNHVVVGPRLRPRKIQRSLTEPFNFGDFFFGQLVRRLVGRHCERDPVPVEELRVVERARFYPVIKVPVGYGGADDSFPLDVESGSSVFPSSMLVL